MKKIYLCTLTFFLGLNGYGQAIKEIPKSSLLKTINQRVSEVKQAPIASSRAGGTDIWSSDFSNSGEWTIGSQSGTQGNWQIGTYQLMSTDAQAGTYLMPLHSDTNKYAFFEGLKYIIDNSASDQNAWIENTNALDLSAYNTITVKFYQNYRSFNFDNTFVELSLDGGVTWTQSIDPNAAITTNSFITDHVQSINFNVNNSNNVKIRFRWESILGQNDPIMGAGYAWQIDDLVITQTFNNDLATSNLLFSDLNGLTYARVPQKQITPVLSSVVVHNIGVQTQNNVQLQAEENSLGYLETSAPIALNSGTDDTLTIPLANAFTPINNGDYTINYTLLADETDEEPSNNQLGSYHYSVGGNLYAVDTSTTAKSGIQSPGQEYISPLQYVSPDNFVLTIPYSISQEDTIYGIDFQFGPAEIGGEVSLNPGTLIIGQLLKLDPNATDPANLFVSLGVTEQYLIGGASDAWTYHTLKLLTPTALQANAVYAVAIRSFDWHYSIATKGHINDGQIFEQSPSNNGNYYYYPEGDIQAPVIRMNFNPQLASIYNAGNIIGVNNICINGSFTYTSDGTANGTWKIMDPGVATVDAGGTVTGLSQGTTTLYYVVRDSLNVPVDSSSISLQVRGPLDAGLIYGDTVVCNGASATLTSNGETGGIWKSFDPSIASVSSQGVYVGNSVGNTEIYYVLPTTDACLGDSTAINVYVQMLPNTGTLSGDQNINVGSTATIQTNGDVGGQWSSSDPSIATISSSGVVTGIAPGTCVIYYELINSNGCSNVSTLTVVVKSNAGLIQYNLDGAVRVVPNPASAYVSVKSEDNKDIYAISIFNNLGQSVLYSKEKGGTKEKIINLSSLSKGFYFVHIKLANSMIIRKLVVE